MTNIVERLHRGVYPDETGFASTNATMAEAAAEIERLQQECARMASEKACLGIDTRRLRIALAEIITLRPEDMPHAIENSQAAAIARDALEQPPAKDTTP